MSTAAAVEERTGSCVRLHLDGRDPSNSRFEINGFDITHLVLAKGLSAELVENKDNFGLAYPVVHFTIAPDHLVLTTDHAEFLAAVKSTKNLRTRGWLARRRIRTALRKFKGATK